MFIRIAPSLIKGHMLLFNHTLYAEAALITKLLLKGYEAYSTLPKNISYHSSETALLTMILAANNAKD